jgi:predicted kinase
VIGQGAGTSGAYGRPLPPGGGRGLRPQRCRVVIETVFVVVSGPPASGKSTLAPRLAHDLGLPLVAKDTIKDALMSVLPVPDVESSRQIGRGAVAAMLAVAAESPIGAVIESNFYRSVAVGDLRQLPGRVVEVFCRCEQAIASDRYRSRAGTRHAGHFDVVRSHQDLWNEEVAEPVAGGWPVLEVNTNEPVDVAEVLAFVRTATNRHERD